MIGYDDGYDMLTDGLRLKTEGAADARTVGPGINTRRPYPLRATHKITSKPLPTALSSPSSFISFMNGLRSDGLKIAQKEHS